jgi:hypothetical protein
LSVYIAVFNSCYVTGPHVIVAVNRIYSRPHLGYLTLKVEAPRSFETSGATHRPVANPVPEVRCSGRVQNVLLLPLSSVPQKLRFNAAFSGVIVVKFILKNELTN